MSPGMVVLIFFLVAVISLAVIAFGFAALKYGLE